MLKLTAEGCKSRRERLIANTEVDLLIITDPRHIQYLTGLYISPLTLGAWGHNYLVIDTRSGEATLLVHSMVSGGAYVDQVEVWTWYDAATKAGVPVYSTGLQVLNKHLDKLSFNKAGIEWGLLPYGAHITEITDITPVLMKIRRHKDPDELDLIRASIHAIDAGHKAIREKIKPGLTELDVFNIVMSAIVKDAGHAVLPMGDFVSGERTYHEGGLPSSRKLQAGELMILDIGPVVNGYKGDFTATLSVDGKLTEKQQALELALLAALSAGEAMLRPGTKGADVHHAIRDELTRQGFANGFTHHAGHGLGLGHPEAPFFVPESTDTIQVGDVVTLEPGSYNVEEGFGGRIEHNYLITEHGYEQLSHHVLTFR